MTNLSGDIEAEAKKKMAEETKVDVEDKDLGTPSTPAASKQPDTPGTIKTPGTDIKTPEIPPKADFDSSDSEDDEDDSWKPKSPKMGGLIEVGKNDFMAWTGGQPLYTWRGLKEKNPMPRTALQYRPTGGSSIKGYMSRTRGLKVKFNKDSELETFITNVFDHLKETGLDSVTYLPDPAKKPHTTNMISVVEYQGKFTLKYTEEETKRLKLLWDMYDQKNDSEATQFLLNSLEHNFKKNIQQIINCEDTFNVVWITIMRKCNQKSLEYFRKMEDAIKKTSPLSYDGQNIDLWAQAVRTNVNLLVNSGQYEHKLSEHIINQALTAGGDNNEDWKLVIRPLKRDLREKLREIGLFSDKKDMNRVMAKANLTPEDILSTIESEYASLMNTDE